MQAGRLGTLLHPEPATRGHQGKTPYEALRQKLESTEELSLDIDNHTDESDIHRRYRVEVVGRAKTIRQRLYAISRERRIRHPGVLTITERARREVFG